MSERLDIFRVTVSLCLLDSIRTVYKFRKDDPRVLLIGIDEAGYGPLLGPLCHGFCAIRCPDSGQTPLDLWELLHPIVTHYPGSNGTIVIDDSKRVFSSAFGLRLLLRGVHAFLECVEKVEISSASAVRQVHGPGGSTGLISNECQLFERILPASDRKMLEEDAWGCLLQNMDPTIGQAEMSAPPVHPSLFPSPALSPASNHKADISDLRNALVCGGIEVLAVGARALSAKHFNTALRSSDNKADLSWSIFAEQLKILMPLARPQENIYVVIDRQGGRKFYAGRVSALFSESMLWIETETPVASVYKIEDNGRTVRVAFLVDADSHMLPVALGSMAAKFARELCMKRFNDFFKRHDPELKPTAGYYRDANRFLRDTQVLRQKLGIDDKVLVRRK